MSLRINMFLYKFCSPDLNSLLLSFRQLLKKIDNNFNKYLMKWKVKKMF
jgi:hypothetical protein